MDYKYIEQLLDRYFQADTTEQEELILRTFFAQDDAQVPPQLRQYGPLFRAMQPAGRLGDDFDQRLLALTREPSPAKARTISLSQRLQPLMKAAAIVAIVLTLGTAMDSALQAPRQQGDEINYAAYKDTYDDPTVAYDKVEDALQLLSEGFSRVQQADSVRIDSLHNTYE